MATLGLIGARGYTGAELLQLLDGHDQIDVQTVSSRRLAGHAVKDHVQGIELDLSFEDLSPEAAAQRGHDAYVLALPNRAGGPYLEAIEEHCPDALVVDLSADHRFDADWQYGLPERLRESIAPARRIANPGCYATAMQLALLPLVGRLDDPPHVFGISGYSGAGSSPSPKNDPRRLLDNVLPYKLTDHIHEDEVRHQLGQSLYFMPHVAPFFRGIILTVSTVLKDAATEDEVLDHFRYFYEDEPLVTVQKESPLARDAVGTHGAFLGGFTVGREGHRLVFNATLDNLLKGAASQALQNLNLALGFDELEGLSP